ncbi:unnamed protein product [Schistosoma mattheei]|uniref:Uncharacterized protein n=1 Tax=Schistosoma mattheei TaxID=31246 RepID=A0A183NI44_9TREM|nr:unnamed protein product [Schistosoma mattheei]
MNLDEIVYLKSVSKTNSRYASATDIDSKTEIALGF